MCPEPAQCSSATLSAPPQRKRSKLKYQSMATKQKEKTGKMGRRYKNGDSEPGCHSAKFHLNSLSLLLKVNRVRRQEVKKEMCDVTRIFTLTRDRNIFLTLKEDMIPSKGYFTPMINNSRLTPPRLYGHRAPAITNVTWVTPHTENQELLELDV